MARARDAEVTRSPLVVTVTVSAVFTTVMALAALPAPLYPVYERQDDLSLLAISCVFAAYLVGVAATMLLGGRVSDRHGRRAAVSWGCAVALAAAGVFLIAPTLGGLLVARFLTGVAVGLVSVAATSQLFDLWPAVPGRSRSVGEVVGTVANLGGIGLGAVAGAVSVGVSASPLATPYWVYVLVLCAVWTAMAATTDRSRPQPLAAPPPRLPRHRPHEPRTERWHDLGTTCLGAFVTMATLGFFSSLGPNFLEGQADPVSSALTGLVVASPFLMSAVVQVGVREVEGQPFVLGLVLVPLGLAASVTSMVTSQPWLFLGGGVVSGAGCGLVFRWSLRRVALASNPARLGAVTSRFLLAGYLGPVVPVVALGLVSDVSDPVVATLLFTAGIGLCCALLLVDHHRRSPRHRDAFPLREAQQVTTRGTTR